MTPKKFVKRPIPVEAIQWDGTEEQGREIEVWTRGSGMPALLTTYPDGDHVLYVETREGTMWASKGDWIIKGIADEFYPCTPGIFAATYEPVGSVA